MAKASISFYFQKALKTFMDAKRISKSEMAKRLGIARPQLDSYLNGRTTPSLGTLEKLSEKLGVPAESLLIDPRSEMDHPIEECHRRIGQLVSRHAQTDRWMERAIHGTLSEKDLADIEAALERNKNDPSKKSVG